MTAPDSSPPPIHRKNGMSRITKVWNQKTNHASSPTKYKSSPSNHRTVALGRSSFPLPRGLLRCSYPPLRPPRVPGLLRNGQKRGRRTHSGPVCWCVFFCSMRLILGMWCP